MTNHTLNSQVIKQAAAMIPQAKREARAFIKYAQTQPQPEEESLLSKLTNPSQYVKYLENIPAFKGLMDTASKKTTEFLTEGPAKQKVGEIIKSAIVPHMQEFLQQNKQKLPSYVSDNKLCVDDFLKTLDKNSILKMVVDAISKDSTLVASIVSITRPIFTSASKSANLNGRLKKEADLIDWVPLLLKLMGLGTGWYIGYFVVRFLWWFASSALWPLVKTVLVGIAGYYIYQSFTKSFGNFGSPKELQSMLPSFLQFGKQVATYDALEKLADTKNFQDLQKIVKESGKTQFKIPDNVQQELLITKDTKEFKTVLDKHKAELTEKVEETAGSNSGFEGLGSDSIWSKVFGLFGNYGSIFGIIIAALGALLVSQKMFA
jgi:hypothetical protein